MTNIVESGKRHILHPFEPVMGKACRLLILGSIPSVRSVQEGFFYMHPQNRFWKLMSTLLGEDLTAAQAAERRSVLLAHNIGLYDAIYACDIVGSSDSRIENVVAADIPALIAGTAVQAIFCNGARAYNELLRYHPQLSAMTVKLPSTSPANAACSMQGLLEAWGVIMRYVG